MQLVRQLAIPIMREACIYKVLEKIRTVLSDVIAIPINSHQVDVHEVTNPLFKGSGCIDFGKR